MTPTTSTTPDELVGSFDVIVIGAGINGVGIARDAAARGLRVALLEQRDICSGVSAWSGRLIHGGLRYLEHYDVPLVRESLRERERLFRLAPHLVKPEWLLMPFYKHNRRPPWLIRLGMITYDVLSMDKKASHHKILRGSQTLVRFPGIGRDGLTGAAAFIDGQVELAERLCVELAVAAQADGAVVRTRAQVDAPLLEGGRVVGVRFTDTEDGSVHEVRGSVVVNVAGPWIDQVFAAETLGTAPPQPRLNEGTKGSHVVVDKFPGAPSDVVYYESRADGRLVLVIPWCGRYMLGTTDIRVEGDPDDARCDADEVDYILGEVNSLVPQANLTPDDVLYTMSGVRPLPHVPDVKDTSAIPRSHVLHDHGEGLENLVTVVGGKLTTYRQLAEDVVDDALRRLGRPKTPTTTRTTPFPGARTTDLARFGRDFVRTAGLPEASAQRLVDVYGTRAPEVLVTIRSVHGLDEVVDPRTGTLAGELVFAVDHEMARSLTDVLARRTMLAFEPGHVLDRVEQVADVLAEHLGWDDTERKAQIEDYRTWLQRLAVPSRDPQTVGA
ncbi:MAG: glycerol-3-phosphate dehydrogenase [Nocardioidaceae bacterium]|nr:glycerol-3-phosphate dehydrogenase [Nocardioidaceae bacterium]